MPVVFIRHIGANLAFIHSLEGVDPGFGVGGGVDPGYGIPTFPHPGHGLPGGGHISNALPGAPGSPGNELPAGPPPHVPAGVVLVLVRDAGGVWHYATTAPGTPPPTTLPEPPPGTIWPPPPVAGMPLPPVPPPTAGTPLPPTAAPKR